MRRRAASDRDAGRSPPASRRSAGSRRPGTIEGGDTFWLRPDLLCIGRTLRTNAEGARQLAAIVGGDVRIFDVPYWRGPAELIHLLSVISPVADDLAVVYLPLLPVGLWELLGELGIRLVEVPDEEFPTLGCNVLAVRPGVVIVAEGNPRHAAALAAAGCEVHTYPATEVGDQRLGRADLPDPADPAWLTSRAAAVASTADAAASRTSSALVRHAEHHRLRGGRRGVGRATPRASSG